MNKYAQGLGLPSSWAFTDVFGFEPDLLGMVPRPVLAVVLLYPETEQTKSKTIGQADDNKSVYYMKQTIGNACGTVGLIHALLNNAESLKMADGSVLSNMLKNTKNLTPEERASYLEKDEEFGKAHDQSAQEGQTEAPSIDEKVNHHFIAFVHHEGGLYELDGRKSGPMRHGDTTPETLLEDTALVVKEFMARDPTEVNFTVIALAKAD